MPRILSRLACAVTASLALAGCGGGGGSSNTTTQATTTVVGGFQVLEVIDFHETEFSITPKHVKLNFYGYYGIKAINDGGATHALTVVGHGINKTTGDIAPGESKSFSVYFKRAGNYVVYCPIDGHRAKGMQATIRVH